MRIILFLTYMLLVSTSYCTIYEIYSFDQVNPHLKELNSDTLVIFDVDGVISIPKNPCLRLKNFSKYGDLISSMMTALSKEEKDYFIGLLAIDSGDQLVDHSIPDFIHRIQTSNAKVIALTAIPSGKVDKVENMTIWRQQQLFAHGIDLSKSFQEERLIIFDEFPQNLNCYPSFYKGVLTSNGIGVTSKGDVLVTFLDKMQVLPKRIIFFDDHLNHLENVEKALSAVSTSISFVGFHYRGAQLIDSSVSPEKFKDKINELVMKAKAEGQAVCY